MFLVSLLPCLPGWHRLHLPVSLPCPVDLLSPGKVTECWQLGRPPPTRAPWLGLLPPGPGRVLRTAAPTAHPPGQLVHFVSLLRASVTMATATSLSHPSLGEVGQEFLYFKKLLLSEGKRPKKETCYLWTGLGFPS